MTPKNTRVLAYSDVDADPARQKLWGDYWFKQYLEQALRENNCPVDDGEAELVIHLFGAPLDELPPCPRRLLWIHSHPDWITAGILGRYTQIYSSSPSYARELAAAGIPAEWLMTPTHMTPLPRRQTLDLVFVGNNRQDGLRKIARDLLSIEKDLPVVPAFYGNGWKGTIPDPWLRAHSLPNEQLNDLYSSSKLVLNDHHEDMAREGFINPRIIDALAAGALPITDPVLGLSDIADLPVYRSPDELLHLIRRYLANEPEREALVAAAQPRIASFTYDRAVQTILERLNVCSSSAPC